MFILPFRFAVTQFINFSNPWYSFYICYFVKKQNNPICLISCYFVKHPVCLITVSVFYTISEGRQGREMTTPTTQLSSSHDRQLTCQSPLTVTLPMLLLLCIWLCLNVCMCVCVLDSYVMLLPDCKLSMALNASWLTSVPLLQFTLLSY